MEDYMVTTIDNPYNPFTQYDEWLRCDTIELKHNTNGMLALYCNASNAMSDADYDLEADLAADKLCTINPIYIKVTKEGKVLPVKDNYY